MLCTLQNGHLRPSGTMCCMRPRLQATPSPQRIALQPGRAVSKRGLLRSEVGTTTILQDYELVVVGSGNGACAFITKYLQATQGQQQRRVLVIEEGQDFLRTSAITHQANWTRSYGEQSIYKLHAATTGPKAGNRPIITGRAVTQGGGGSINYTMMHEASDWLAQQLGAGGAFDAKYWDSLKQDLGVLFQRRDPSPQRTPVAQKLWEAIINPDEGGGFFADVHNSECTGWVPEYVNGDPQGRALGRVYTFTTQFNEWGQRTNSGVSLVAGGRAWREHSRVDLWTDARVEELKFDDSNLASNGAPPQVPCSGLTIRHLGVRDKLEHVTFDPQRTTVVLAAGSSTPRLLMPHRNALQNPAIGTRVNDHILLPAGFYALKQAADGSPHVSPKDQYLPLFPEQEVTINIPRRSSSSGKGASNGSSGDGGGSNGSSTDSESVTVTVGYDFFAGPVSELSYFLAHLFVSLWMPNWLKTVCLNNPWVFLNLKQVTAWFIQGAQGTINIYYGLLSGGRPVPPIYVITGTNKFNIFYEGHYEEPQPGEPSDSSTRIVLKCFAAGPDGSSSRDATTTPDGLVAVQTMAPLMRKLDVVGDRPWRWVQVLLKALVGLPYNPESLEDIQAYVRKYAASHLLTEQHMSGGCVLGHAAEDGSAGPDTTGRVKGTANVVVADLSAVPLPRVSPQMTAYLLGYHIATQRFGDQQVLQQQQQQQQQQQKEKAGGEAAVVVSGANAVEQRRR